MHRGRQQRRLHRRARSPPPTACLTSTPPATAAAGPRWRVFELEPYSAIRHRRLPELLRDRTPVTNITVDGGPGTGAGQGEAALDIEDLIGLAPNALDPRLLGQEQRQRRHRHLPGDRHPEPRQGHLHLVGAVRAAGGRARPPRAENTLFQEAAVQGQTIFAASGDHGVKDCTSGSHSSSAAVDDPASQPYVTGVGGTSLSAVGPPPTESVWNSTWNTGSGAASGAGGGGVSVLWGLPSYQSGVALAQSGGGVRRRGHLLPRGPRRLGRRRHPHRLQHLLQPPLVDLRRHQRRRADLGGARRARQRLGGVHRQERRVCQPGPLSGGAPAPTARTSTTSPPATTPSAGSPASAPAPAMTWPPGWARPRVRRWPPCPVRLHLDPACAAAPAPAPTPAPGAGRHADPPGGADRPCRPARPAPAARHRQRRPGPHLPRRPACPPACRSRAATGPDHRQPHARGQVHRHRSPSPTPRARPRRRPSPGRSPAGRRSPAGSRVNAKGRPSLSLKVGAGRNAPPIQSIVVAPSGAGPLRPPGP